VRPPGDDLESINSDVASGAPDREGSRMAGSRVSRVLPVAIALCLLAACTSGSDGARGPEPSPHAVGGSTASTDPALAAFYDQQVSWHGCHDGFECAKVRVPVDYAAPSGASITLSVVRLPSHGGERLGSLLLNPGGPGASGIGSALDAETTISATVRRHYDIVGFDPRGIDASAPIHCLTDAQTDQFIEQDGSPDNSAEESALVRISRQLGQRCAARNGPLLAHVGTRDAARDLDVLRGVLGDAKLNFLGKSYGTYLGAIYAETFPDRVGRLVLDGVVDPADDTAALERSQAVGFERALASFVDDCLPRRGCPLTGDRASALAQVSGILAAADRVPLRASRPVTQALAVLGVAFAMYDPGFWPVLREALSRALNGDGSLLLLLANSYLNRTAKGHYPTNANDAMYAISCLDRPETADLGVLRARAKAFSAIAPRFGAFLAWSTLPCAFWPVPAEGKPAAVHAAGAGPILVVGTTRDPATPYASAKHLAAELDSGRLLTYDGDGHSAYEEGSACIDAAVDAYLVAGTLPAAGTRCR
jgi:pimeloyl-ACP methyl ester carboxylesterase